MERQYKKMYRLDKDRILGGVCGGVAEYFEMEASLVRLIFSVLILFGGWGGIIYLILWILLPMKYEPEAFTYQSKQHNFNQNNMENQSKNSGKENNENQSGKNALLGGILLIVLGLLFLMDKLIPDIHFRDVWPVILIVIGVIMVFNNYKGLKK